MTPDPQELTAEESPFKGASGLRRIIGAARNSLAGLTEAIRCEHAFRQELVLAAILVPLGLWFGANAVERALLVGVVLLVLVVELLNAALEATVDRISLEQHPLAKRAKDIGSAAVLISLVNAVVVWALVAAGR